MRLPQPPYTGTILSGGSSQGVVARPERCQSMPSPFKLDPGEACWCNRGKDCDGSHEYNRRSGECCGECGEEFEISEADPHWSTGRGPICPKLARREPMATRPPGHGLPQAAPWAGRALGRVDHRLSARSRHSIARRSGTGARHLRLNFALLTGGARLVAAAPAFRIGEHFVAFWSDRSHRVEPGDGRRVVLSVGFSLRDHAGDR